MARRARGGKGAHEAMATQLARKRCAKAIDILAEIAGNVDVVASTRVSAAMALLDRGWGKPVQASAVEPPAPIIRYNLTLDDVIAARAEILDEC